MSKRITAGLCLLVAMMLLAGAGQAQEPPAPSSPREESSRQQEAAREAHQRVPEIFEAMRVRPGATVADVGAGGGFLTVRLARAVGIEGRVMAIDVDPTVLDRLRARVQEEGLANVTVIHGRPDDPQLPPASLDAAVIMNAYHEMPSHQAVLGHLRRALRPDGRLVIIEPLSEKRRYESRDVQIREHEIALPFIESEVREAGFRIARTEDPFTVQGSSTMSLLVAVPDPQAVNRTTPSADRNSGPHATPRPSEDLAAESAALNSPDLRVSLDRFKELREQARIVVVDVRTGVEYRSAHIPDAISIPLDRIAEELERLRALGKPVVTYCT
ncbi:MAG: methyltransferase domain-containing protein [Acidobacteria bacterium]|nr:methyltransferase domain-containing protein [Acidobacteriota bacterium]